MKIIRYQNLLPGCFTVNAFTNKIMTKLYRKTALFFLLNFDQYQFLSLYNLFSQNNSPYVEVAVQSCFSKNCFEKCSKTDRKTPM